MVNKYLAASLFLVLFCFLFFWPLLSDYRDKQATADYTDIAAADMALATMCDSPQPTPAPGKCERCGGDGWLDHGDGHRTQCPDCNPGVAPLPTIGGPVDTIREAKALIRKANKAVDRGTAILDAVERDGKVSVDIKLPRPAVKAVRTRIIRQRVCDGQSCHYEDVEVPIDDDEPTPFDMPDQDDEPVAEPRAAGACNSCGSNSTFRRRGLFFRRWR